jgi:ABC-type uncharacterized transport system permease subunit
MEIKWIVLTLFVVFGIPYLEEKLEKDFLWCSIISVIIWIIFVQI